MNNFFDSFPYLQQMNEQFRNIFGDDFVRNLMSSMQSQGWMNGQQGYPWAMPQPGGVDRKNPNQSGTGPSPADGEGGHSAGPEGGPGAPMWNPFAAQSTAPGLFPLVDILDMRHEIILVVDVPGLERASDVRISVHPDRILIKGELQRLYDKNKEYAILQSERRVGQFDRSIVLPVRVRKQHAKAIYHQGLLEIRLLKEGKAPENDGTVIDVDFA